MTLPLLHPEPAEVERRAREDALNEIPLSRPDISESDIQAVVDVLRTPSLSLGPKLPEFEAAFAKYVGTRYATATNSGTAALHLAVRGLEIGPGDEVITTPFSFVASANCLLFEQAVPVFVDVDCQSFNLDPNLIESKLTPRTKAILPVHVFGRPANMNAILDIARRHDLAVIEDACEALGARWDGRHVGALGNAGTFAFYPNKQMTTGEGGMVVTDDPALDRVFKSLRNQGRGDTGAWLQHERLGFNYRLSDINCALGLSQLARVDRMLQARREVAEEYRRHLSGIEEIELPIYEMEDAEVSWFVYVVRLKGFGQVARDEVLASLRAEGVACSNYFSPIHLQPYFQQLGYRSGDFPVTEQIASTTIALPFYNKLRTAQISRVAEALKRALSELRKFGRQAPTHS